MSRSLIVKLKNGIELDITIERDYGEEPDTSAWNVDWSYQAIDTDYSISEEESEYTQQRIYEYLRDDYSRGEF